MIDCLEETFIPLYGAKVVIFGSGSAALDMAYECSRAGVDLVTILDEDKLRAQENLDTFLEVFAKNRMSILDTDQARTGHLSATRAYEHTNFSYGSFNALKSMHEADICISLASTHEILPDYSGVLRSSQIICDPWGRSDALMSQALENGCDLVPSEQIMDYWGTACANLLIEFGNAQTAL